MKKQTNECDSALRADTVRGFPSHLASSPQEFLLSAARRPELFSTRRAWFAQQGDALQGKRTFSTWPRVKASHGNALFAQSLLINLGLSSQTIYLLLKGKNRILNKIQLFSKYQHSSHIYSRTTPSSHHLVLQHLRVFTSRSTARFPSRTRAGRFNTSPHPPAREGHPDFTAGAFHVRERALHKKPRGAVQTQRGEWFADTRNGLSCLVFFSFLLSWYT